MNNEVVGLNVVVLPPDNISNQAIDLSTKLFNSNIGASFALEAGMLYPHITIYQAFFPSLNLPEIKNRLSELAKNLDGFEINLNLFTIVFENWLFWNCTKTKNLSDLQARVVEELNPLREGNLPPTLNLSALPKELAEDVSQFGSLLIGRQYLPHITISHFKEPKKAEKAIELTGKGIADSFKLSEITLTTLGELGTVTGIIDTYPIR